MAIPKFHEFCAPILHYLKDKTEPISKKELQKKIISHFNLSDEDLQDFLSNGSSRFVGNLSWAIVYLKQSNLIEYVNKGIYTITDSGKEFIQKYPQFDLNILKDNIPSLKEWIKGTKKSIPSDSENNNEISTEQENNDNVILATEDYYESIESDILERLKNLGEHSVDKGTRFEDICLELLKKMGYGSTERTGGAGDRGVDGFLTTDKFGFDKIGIQCKCHSDGKINDDQITKFAHGLKHVNGLNRGIFITTTDYTPSAKKVVEELKDIKIILINGNKLAKYMREYQVGIEVIETNYVYDIVIGE